MLFTNPQTPYFFSGKYTYVQQQEIAMLTCVRIESQNDKLFVLEYFGATFSVLIGFFQKGVEAAFASGLSEFCTRPIHWSRVQTVKK